MLPFRLVRCQGSPGTFSPTLYDGTMRVLLFALMIVLLPLRGWVSDAMATNMATAELASSIHIAHAINNVATKAIETRANGTFDVEKSVLAARPHGAASWDNTSATQDVGDVHVAASACAGHAGNADTAAGGDGCQTCAACVSCHLTAIQLSIAALQVFSFPPPAPLLAHRNFTSADTALSQKPPIS